MADLVLDKDVRNWVLLPLTLAILLLMLIRQYATTVPHLPGWLPSLTWIILANSKHSVQD